MIRAKSGLHFIQHPELKRSKLYNTEMHDIMIGKSKIGLISEVGFRVDKVRDFKISLQVKDEVLDSGWRMAKLKKKFPDVKTAKSYFKDNRKQLEKQFSIYKYLDK